jgi:hypothetical protein
MSSIDRSGIEVFAQRPAAALACRANQRCCSSEAAETGMQPQDVFNRAFDDTTVAIEEWLLTLAPHAVVEQERTANYWRVRLKPHQANACPAELMLSRQQVFDLDVGSEGVAGQHIQDFRVFKPLLEAVVAGRCVTRSWNSQATGAELTREFIANLDAERQWTIRRVVHAGSTATELTAVARDHVYVPYDRG